MQYVVCAFQRTFLRDCSALYHRRLAILSFFLSVYVFYYSITYIEKEKFLEPNASAWTKQKTHSPEDRFCLYTMAIPSLEFHNICLQLQITIKTIHIYAFYVGKSTAQTITYIIICRSRFINHPMNAYVIMPIKTLSILPRGLSCANVVNFKQTDRYIGVFEQEETLTIQQIHCRTARQTVQNVRTIFDCSSMWPFMQICRYGLTLKLTNGHQTVSKSHVESPQWSMSLVVDGQKTLIWQEKTEELEISSVSIQHCLMHLTSRCGHLERFLTKYSYHQSPLVLMFLLMHCKQNQRHRYIYHSKKKYISRYTHQYAKKAN